MAGGRNAPAGARSVEDGRFNGRFTPTGKRVDIAKKTQPTQRGKGSVSLLYAATPSFDRRSAQKVAKAALDGPHPGSPSAIRSSSFRGRDKARMRHCPYSLLAPGTPPSNTAPRTSRGDGAPSGASFRSPRLAAWAPFGEGCAPLGAPSQRLCGAGPRFLTFRFRLARGLRKRGPFWVAAGREPRASLNGQPSASSSQGIVVSPGGAPAPPGSWGVRSSPARGRRVRSHSHDSALGGPNGTRTTYLGNKVKRRLNCHGRDKPGDDKS